MKPGKKKEKKKIFRPTFKNSPTHPVSNHIFLHKSIYIYKKKNKIKDHSNDE